MASVIGLGADKVAELCAAASEQCEEGSVQIANYLCNGNYACSGAMEAVDKIVEIAKPEFKARMAVKLAVAGAFHTDFMAPAVSKLEEVLAGVEVKKPRIPVVSNVDAKPHSDPAVIKDILTKQVTAPVQWETIMTDLVASGYDAGYELGQLKEVGFSATDCKAAGYTCEELRAVGFSAKECRGAGWSCTELRDAEVPLLELKDCGFSAKQLGDA